MKEKKNWKSAAVMLTCTTAIVVGGAVGLHTAMKHLQSEELSAESSVTSGQNTDAEQIVLSAEGTDAGAAGLESAQASQDEPSAKQEQKEQEQAENTKDPAEMTDERGKYISRSRGAFADSTADKLYFHTLSSADRLYYFDLKNGQFGPFCGIDGCSHDTFKCNAHFSTDLIMDSLQVVDDKLYVFRNSSYRKTPYRNAVLYRMDLDGSNREDITIFRADAVFRGAKIINDTIYAACEMEEGVDWRLFKQSIYGNEQAQEIFPAGQNHWKYRHIEIEAAAGDKLYFKASRYKGDVIGEESAHWERTLWEYDTRSGQFTELLNSDKGHWNEDFNFFLADGCLYFTYVNSTSTPRITYHPIECLDLASGQIKTTKFAPGRLEGYDGTYCYIGIYDGKSTKYKAQSIKVYTLDGTCVQTIDVPDTPDASEEYKYEISSVGCTYDAIVMHHRRYQDKDGTSDSYEDVYVYDKKQIGQPDGTWAKFSIHDSFDSDGKEITHEISQE